MKPDKLFCRCAVVALAAAVLIGPFTWPSGLEATVVWASALLLLKSCLRRSDIRLPFYLQVLFAASIIVALHFLVTTNAMVLIAGNSLVIVTLLLLLIAKAGGKAPPDEITGIAGSCGSLLRACVKLAFQGLQNLSKIDRAVLRGSASAIIPLAVFQLLFASINPRYREFSDQVVQYLSSGEFLKAAAYTALLTVLLYCALSAQINTPSIDPGAPRRREWLFLLIPILALFAVFSFFQGRYLFMPVAALPFKEFSLYVQKGFWQLVWVALCGALLWTLVRRFAADSSSIKSGRVLLVFAIELLLIAVFSLHKVLLLEWFFGLKDSRVLATGAALLAAVSFLSCTAVLSRPSFGRLLIRIPLAFCAAMVAFLTAVNIDQTITRYYPARYRSGEGYSKDYAYLLTNSYDNSEEWGDLMLEMLDGGLKQPENYYWGAYRPLCELTTTEKGERIVVNHLKEYHLELHRRWLSCNSPLGFLRMNYRIKNAARFLEANAALVRDVYELVEKNCSQGGPVL